MQDNLFGLTAASELGKVLPKVTNLKELILRNCNVGSTYSSHIFNGLKYNNSLQLIDLANNSIGDIGAQSLSTMIREKRDYDKLTIVLRSN